jgi:pyrroloquinoline-quinone synthase
METQSGGSALLSQLDERIARWHLLKHPFYQAWQAGKLTQEELAVYAAQYYRQVEAFPEYLRVLSSRAQGELRQLVEENLAEELDPALPHPELWRRFAAALGASGDALDAAAPLEGIRALVDTYRQICECEPLPAAVAALYAYEAQVPEIAAQKAEGLRHFYGINDPQGVAYFTVHEEADVRHRAAWRKWLAEQPEGDTGRTVDAAERALKALWGALDAVYPQGVACKN